MISVWWLIPTIVVAQGMGITCVALCSAARGKKTED